MSLVNISARRIFKVVAMGTEVTLKGENTGVTSFLKWYRFLDIKSPINLHTESKWIGIKYSMLPLIAAGLKTPRDAGGIPVKVAKLLYLLDGDGEECKSGNEAGTKWRISFPTAKSKLRSKNVIDALSIESALEAKDKLLKLSGEVTVYGGFEGLIAADVLQKIGLKPRLIYEGKPFTNIFDPDMSAIATSIIERKGLEIIPLLKEDRTPIFLYGQGHYIEFAHTEENLILDLIKEAWGFFNLPLSDYTYEKLGFTAAHYIKGIYVSVPPPSRYAYFSDTTFLSVGITVQRAKGFDYAATRISIKRRGERVGAIKLVADRQNLVLVGAQAIVPMEEKGLLELLYLAVSARIPLMLLTQSAESGSITDALAEGLWRKASLKFYRKAFKNSRT